MEAGAPVTLGRQIGLLREISQVANNLANMSTTGFRREGLVYVETVHDAGPGAASVSFASGIAGRLGSAQGGLRKTGGAFDLAIEGPGFFRVATPAGDRLTRAGSFSPDATGDLVTPDGHRLLDQGGSPIFVPPDAGTVSIAADGTVSTEAGPLAQIALWQPAGGARLDRVDGVLFSFAEEPVPIETAAIVQGFLEGSNVDPILEMARMIEIQRGYELGQSFLDREDERIRGLMRTLGR